MRTVGWVTFYSGLLIGLGPFVGSGAHAVLHRIELKFPAAAEAVAALLWAGLSYLLIDALAPGSTDFRNSSAVGFLSSSVLTVWESVALWAGLSVTVGIVAPLFPRPHKGSSGIAPVAALLAVFSPGTLVAAFAAWFLSLGILDRPRLALAVTFGSVAVTEWLLSLLRIQAPWGIIHGPESTLWVTACAGVLLARWTHGDDQTLA